MTKTLFLDTNIFIYTFDKSSSPHRNCLKLIRYCCDHQISLVTSCETIQEIIHLGINTKKRENGILLSEKTIDLCDEIYAISKNTIDIYLEKVKKYKNKSSRDLIQLASCLENNVESLITYDKDFQQFKEINSQTPEQFTKTAR